MSSNQTDIFGSNKLWSCLVRVSDYQTNGITRPVTMELDLTDKCNHRCPQCVGGREAHEMLATDARSILTQMADYGVRGVIFTGGGEPLMHLDCVSLCAFASELGLKVGLITNGTRLTEDDARNLVSVCSWVRVSLDAGDDAMYKLVHGVHGLSRATTAIGFLSSAKRRLNADCTVGVGYLTSAETKRGMLDATLLTRRMFADYLQFRPFHYDQTDILDALAVCRQYETDTFRVIASEQKYRHFDNWHRPYQKCHGACFVGVIQADGSVPICCHYRGVQNMKFGNVLKQSLPELWEGQVKKDLLDSIDVQRCVPFCRADHINRLLQDAVTPKTHPEFL